MSGNGWFQWIVHIEILRWAACWKRPSVVRQSSGNFHLCQHLEHIKSHHYEFPCYIYNLLIIDCCLMPPTPTVALMAFEQSFFNRAADPCLFNMLSRNWLYGVAPDSDDLIVIPLQPVSYGPHRSPGKCFHAVIKLKQYYDYACTFVKSRFYPPLAWLLFEQA